MIALGYITLALLGVAALALLAMTASIIALACVSHEIREDE